MLHKSSLLNDLVEKWRKEAAAEWAKRQNKDLSEWVRDRCHGQHARLLSCADELEAALSPAELGGVATIVSENSNGT